MHWLQTIDVQLFHWVNPTLSNPWLDRIMPFCSGNPFFAPVLVLGCVALIWKGGARGRVCVAMLLLAVALGDTLVCNTIKQLVARPRPFFDLADAHVPASIGRSDSGSMPSSHAANWFAAMMVLLIYYRQSWRFMLPAAVLVSFSRVYNGVHYPSDVLVGAILGAGYAAGGVWSLDALWRWLGPRCFPIWWAEFPSLMVVQPKQAVESSVADGEIGSDSVAGGAPTGVLPAKTSRSKKPDTAARSELEARQWISLGYGLIFLQLFLQLLFLASGKIDVAEDEAYQWLWSKHLALSYYSKPPLIAYTHFLGTSIWGDTPFGVHFFSPIISALIQICLLRFFVRNVGARAAFWVSILCAAIPLLALGNMLMTVDPLSVMFWTLAMLAGWRAIQEDSSSRDWLWVGLWMGLGFLSKYTALFQWLCWAVVFVLWPPARKQLRRPGLYLALAMNLLCALPVLIWNQQHGWITVEHVADDGKMGQGWAPTPANLWYGFSRFTLDFVEVETLILNPFIVLPVIWAAFALWKQEKNRASMLYFFSMGAPVVIIYFLWTFHSRVLPNWIAPAILPFLCLAVIYWNQQWRAGSRAIKGWLTAALVVGGMVELLMHSPNLIPKLLGRNVSARYNPLRRLSGWQETAQAVEVARQKLLAEGQPTFIIGGHYGITSEVAFNLPAARTDLLKQPLVFYQSSAKPDTQFYFWPGYEKRKGQNAIYVQELGLTGTDTDPVPERLKQEFESTTDLGAVKVQYRGQFIRRIQIIECRGLR